MRGIQLIHNAGEFAVEKYERIAKDQRIHGVLRVLDDEVVRIVTAAQPRVMARSSSIRPTSLVDNSPGGSHSVHRDAGVALNPPLQGFGQSYDGLPADLIGLSAAIPDVAWSPALADEIGWDWGAFGQLFVEPPI